MPVEDVALGVLLGAITRQTLSEIGEFIELPTIVANIWARTDELRKRPLKKYLESTEGETLDPNEVLPNLKIYVPTLDPTKLEKLLYKPINFQGKPGLYIQLQFSDEVYPLSRRIDEEYREIRKHIYGTTKDMEVFIVYRRGKDMYVYFPRTFASIQPYYTSRHLIAIKRFTGKIYVRTWNHMYNTWPNPLHDYIVYDESNLKMEEK